MSTIARLVSCSIAKVANDDEITILIFEFKTYVALDVLLALNVECDQLVRSERIYLLDVSFLSLLLLLLLGLNQYLWLSAYLLCAPGSELGLIIRFQMLPT